MSRLPKWTLKTWSVYTITKYLESLGFAKVIPFPYHRIKKS